MGRVADEALRVLDSSRGTWGGSWEQVLDRLRDLPAERRAWEPDINSAYDPYNATALRGLAWLLSLLPPHPGTARALGALVETSLKKVAGLGPRNPKVANAGVVALARVDSEAALAELARLATRVTYKNTAKLLDTALEARATALGLSREEIEELAVPAYGLTEVGRATYSLGEATALLEIRGSKALLGWRNAAGKPVKSVPAAVKRDHADELKELKTAVKDIDKMLSAQSERLDRQFLSEVLRDADLFVGVSSIGNDPTWQDGGPGGRFQEYWTSYRFGELNQSAETRRLLLERLVPRLAISDRCTLEGRFLHVKSDRHTYKIHLGSGNILRTPNDQYLCIVPKSDPSAPHTGYLPYEGDHMLR